MSRNKPKSKQQSTTKDFAKQVSTLQEEGYVAMPIRQLLGDKATNTPEWEDVLNVAMGVNPNDPCHSSLASSGVGSFASSGNENKCSSGLIGTPNLGWMEWGSGNRLPNLVSTLISLLPYTAAGIKFNTDTAAGLGPVAKYRYATYSNGTVVNQEIDYNAAGELIEGNLLTAYMNLSAVKNYLRTQESGSIDSEEREVNRKMVDRFQKQIVKLEKDFEKWKSTKEALSTFVKNNNLNYIMLQLFSDMVALGICFPEIQLSQDADQRDTTVWKPRATGIDFRSALTCRLERMDIENRINYVYISNRWLTDNNYKDTDQKMAALPALQPKHELPDLERAVRKARKAKVSVKNRPTRFMLPSIYPTIGRPYYPQPSWWSIFGGEIYTYTSTIISDRASRKRNANSFGRIIYIHLDYLKSLFQQMGATTVAEKNQLRDSLWSEINSFLKDSNRSGQSILAFTFTGPDGKEHDSFRIVDVPYNNKNTAEANKTELEELSSIIFFALEIHPDLIGAVPGRTGSSGGTYQREMYLMKQLMMAPTQNIVLRALEVISRFNEWDEHLTWSIKQMTLTTLDRNKNGMEETKV